jgi:hypothetical protein
VNFNNRIQSQELADFPFHVVNGTAFQINAGGLSWGPNGLAPQQTYQDNRTGKYDGSAVWGDHVIRFGGEVTRFVLGGFANFSGPASVTADSGPGQCTDDSDPLTCPLTTFGLGPNAGFFTARPAHNLPFGGKFNTRYAAYVGDTWRLFPNLTLNGGIRWTYDTNFFSSPDVPRLPGLDLYGAGLGDAAKYPKSAFGPQVGFAWDPFKNGKTSIRGGFNLAYEANVFNNSLFDEFARIRSGIGPTALSGDFIHGPTGDPIVVAGICDGPDGNQVGNYDCLFGMPLNAVLPQIAQLNNAVQAAFTGLNYDPQPAPGFPSEFDATQGVTFGGQFPGDYEIPYSMQFNIGFQHELFRGHVLSVDYVRQRTVGLPLMMRDYEERRDARYLDTALARSRIAAAIGNATVNPTTVQAFLNANPNTRISTLNLASDAVWTGLTAQNLRARVYVGGFSLYQGLQVSITGRTGADRFDFLKIGGMSLFKDLSYTLGYALARNTATSGVGRPEFIANTTNNRDYNSDYGPSALDRRHNLTISASMGLIGGFRLDQIYRFSTSAPQNLFLPTVCGNPAGGTVTAGGNYIFCTDVNGDGGSATSRGDLLPGTGIGDFGRRIGSLSDLNEAIAVYNSSFAGQITPHGQALIDAGFVTEAQLRAMGAVLQPIDPIPAGNPDPFENLFTADFRISRPIRIWKESWQLEPSFSVFNVFNNAAKAQYTGLSGACGSLNYNYSIDPDGCNEAGISNPTAARNELEGSRGLRQRRRQLQFGLRFSF